ncbi:serine/threonine-protein phosphatase 1 regulatory subunit 10-like [Vanessa atalanta]|uniref:serine/threonine-protein phosphatase 1 regulatory subunit 10-like n=1 Tax=Vanessa atalanta TaxID=42275 RepID=UPI001FCD41EA|nr:serine/threonine-protein phosphatase 1 regulatory subunit 10-like [Vanessa atalanta]
MPRIDPIQLLNCLSVLLSPTGGIKSRDEVHRLANLMTKFSKKLVSKCIYIQILKCTETDLLGLFMGSGGWRLVHMWLTENIVSKNWPLVRELLELLLLCPVDVERLKTNNCPKLVKELSKDGNHCAIRALASKLVEQWLKAVKGEHVTPIVITDISQIVSDFQSEDKLESLKNDAVFDNEVEKSSNNVENSTFIENDSQDEKIENEGNSCETNHNDTLENEDTSNESDTLPVLKITFKNGKQILSQVEEENKEAEENEKEKNREKHKSKSRDKSYDKSSNSSNSTSSKSSSSSKHSSKSSSDKSRSSSSHKDSKHSSKDKSKDRHSSHSSKSRSSSNSSSSRKSSSSSSSKSRDKNDQKHSSDKDKSREKDKDTKSSTDKSDDKTQTPSIHKLGKIPKLSDLKKERPSISIEVRKPDEPKPKTVKTFNSKFRKHGLEEEIKPPPSRASLLSNKKPPPVLPPTVSIPKRPSPVHNETPPEKKAKTLVDIEKPGSIKLIPPKPKPMVLQESDMFMDALNASATNKKEPKKRKRRTSGSKDGNAQSDGSPPQTPTNLSSPNSENKSVPPRFYQDTLDEDENKDKVTEKHAEPKDNAEQTVSREKDEIESMDTSEPHTLTINGLKGVLCYHKRKGPKKSIKWKPDSELEEIQYFELDETERVNVTKTFTDMKYLERIHEREAFQKARNLSTDDIMEERTSWRPLIPIDIEGQIQIEYGKNSKEKDIQAIRQKGTLQPLYFHKSMIPDSPHEPDIEAHTYNEPTIIPLEDVTGNQDNISDFRNMPWPEPKGNAPPTSNSTMNVPTMFPPNISQFPNNFPPAQFPGVPNFQGPPIMPGDWQNGVVPPIMPNGIPGPMAPSGMAPGAMPPPNMPPGMMVPPENMMMGPEIFGGPNPMFPVPPDGFNMQPNMFPVDYNMSGPPGPDGFPVPGNFRGAMRGRGIGGHWRGKATGGWDGPQRGRGGRGGARKTICIYFQRKGSCRQGENCSFLHPGVNCPF